MFVLILNKRGQQINEITPRNSALACLDVCPWAFYEGSDSGSGILVQHDEGSANALLNQRMRKRTPQPKIHFKRFFFLLFRMSSDPQVIPTSGPN